MNESVVGGAASALELDPDAAAIRADGHTGERACLNCHTLLAGDYCHACGQRAHVHRTLGSLVHDLAHVVFHFEGKIWRTLPMLAWRPGEVTRRYIAGERARFVSPLVLFLFSVFLLATVLSSLPGTGSLEGLKVGLNQSDQSLATAERKNDIAIRQALAEQDMLRRSGGATTNIDRRLAELQNEQQGIRAIRSGKLTEAVTGSSVRSNLDFINERWKHAKQNPDLLIYKLKNSAYKFSWVLVPMSVPFLWLLFPFSRRFGMYDHAIFAIYSLASMSLLTVALSLLALVPGFGSVVGFGLLLLPPLHMFRQLRGAYSLGRTAALIRTALLLISAMTVFILWVVFLMMLGAA